MVSAFMELPRDTNINPYLNIKSAVGIILWTAHSRMVAVDIRSMGLNNIIRKWYRKFMVDWMEKGGVKDSLGGS